MLSTSEFNCAISPPQQHTASMFAGQSFDSAFEIPSSLFLTQDSRGCGSIGSSVDSGIAATSTSTPSHLRGYCHSEKIDNKVEDSCFSAPFSAFTTTSPSSAYPEFSSGYYSTHSRGLEGEFSFNEEDLYHYMNEIINNNNNNNIMGDEKGDSAISSNGSPQPGSGAGDSAPSPAGSGNGALSNGGIVSPSLNPVVGAGSGSSVSSNGPVTVAPPLSDVAAMATSPKEKSVAFASPPVAGATPLLNRNCPVCMEGFNHPKVLACFHTFCKGCLERLIDSPGKIICPQCQAETQVCPDLGVDSLLSDYAVANMMDAALLKSTTDNGTAVPCTGCKSKDLNSVAYCSDCTNFLCSNCVMAHQYMHCFEGHHVKTLAEIDGKLIEKAVKCLQHKTDTLKFFCFTCNIPVCTTCTQTEHPRGVHSLEPISDTGKQQITHMREMLDQAKVKQRALVHTFKSVDLARHRLQTSYTSAQNSINETAGLLQNIIEELRVQLQRDLENCLATKQMALGLLDKKLQNTMEKLTQTIQFTGRLLDFACPAEVLVFKKLLETRLQAILNYNPDVNLQSSVEIEFVSNLQNSRVAIGNTYGYIRGTAADILAPNKSQGAVATTTPAPIGRPSTRGHLQGSNGPVSGGHMNAAIPGVISHSAVAGGAHHHSHTPPTVPATNGLASGGVDPTSMVLSGGFDGGDAATNSYEKWSTTGTEAFPVATTANTSLPPPVSHIPLTASTLDPNSAPFYPPSALAAAAAALVQPIGSQLSPTGPDSVAAQQQIVDLTAQVSMSAAGFPPKSQIKRHKMIFHCKLGEFGVLEGQFTEPSGVAVNATGEIIVADTNNHRVQVFDKEGRFKFQFGECGKRDGQLLYPNRVAVNRATGDIVVTERSPTHQIQVYNQYGQFLRKFGANILQHPRGVTVDVNGRIIIVECKVMRVLIFDMFGNVLQKFSCLKYLEFPNGVCTNDKGEIFISDNRAHCIKVFNYEGQFLRQVGGEGITNYPIGVGINQSGEIVVADNHNNFNLTVFSADGTLINALESKVKHAQCFDVALTDEGSIILASKDYRLYVYRYAQPLASLAISSPTGGMGAFPPLPVSSAAMA